MLGEISTPPRFKIKTAAAQNDATDPMCVMGAFNVSITGTWSGTTKLQRSFNYIDFKRGQIAENQVTWGDVKSYTANAEEVGTFAEPESQVYYRLIVTTYTTGPVFLRLSF